MAEKYKRENVRKQCSECGGETKELITYVEVAKGQTVLDVRNVVGNGASESIYKCS